jgi:DeoR/GlpR family transcriptional regulator of sugar metabolism
MQITKNYDNISTKQLYFSGLFMKSYRQKEIIEMLTRKGVIVTAEIAKEFDVSIETIRRDLDQLEKQGLIKKTYGGAELKMKQHVWPSPLQKRMESFRDSKAAIAARAATYVPDNCTVALDAGTTTLELCPHLNEKKDLIIIASDVHSAAELLAPKTNKVYMMGGFLTPDGTTSGTFAKEFFNYISGIDVFLFSTDGADPEEGLSTDEAGINDLKKRYLKNSQMRIAMIDHSKFQKKAFYKMCPFSDIDILITDSLTPKDIVESIRRRGTKVDVVDV